MRKPVLFSVSLIIILALISAGCAKSSPAEPTIESTSVPAISTSIPETAAIPVLTPTQQVTLPSVTPAVTAVIDLKITGLVTNEMGWSIAELHAMPTTNAGGKNNSGQTQTYSGVLVADLITLSLPKAEATTLVFLDSSGSAVEVPLADTLTCTNCIVTFRSQGGLAFSFLFILNN